MDEDTSLALIAAQGRQVSPCSNVKGRKSILLYIFSAKEVLSVTANNDINMNSAIIQKIFTFVPHVY